MNVESDPSQAADIEGYFTPPRSIGDSSAHADQLSCDLIAQVTQTQCPNPQTVLDRHCQLSSL